MTEFNVGDKVRRTPYLNNGNCPVGTLGEVKSRIGSFLVVKWEGRAFNSEYNYSHEIDCIELVEKETSMNEFQQKVWDYLTSGNGDKAKRMEALKDLSVQGAFLNSSEAITTNIVKSYIASSTKFCQGGKGRALAALFPPETFEVQYVVTITHGSTLQNPQSPAWLEDIVERVISDFPVFHPAIKSAKVQLK